MMLNEQDILGTNEACTKFLKLIPVDELRSSVEQQFKILQTSADRWKSFVQLASSTNKQVCLFISSTITFENQKLRENYE